MKFSPRQREALRLVADGKFYPDFVKEDDGWHARWRAIGVMDGNDWVDEYVRTAAMTALSEDAEDQKHETLHDAWMMALRSATGLVKWDEAECAAFAAELKEWNGSAEEDIEARHSLVFRLEAHEGAFAVTCAIPGSRRGLRALGMSMYSFPALRGLRRVADGAEMLSAPLSHAEAESFVRSGARELRDAGYLVEGVDIAAPVTAEAELDGGEKAPAGGKRPPVAMKLTVKVAGQPVTAEEIRFMLDQGSTLVYFREHWIEVDRNILRQALRALEKRKGGVDSPLSFALGLGRIGSLELAEVKAHGWLRGLVNELQAHRSGDLLDKDDLRRRLKAAGFAGSLRDYQLRGVAWLEFLSSHGFGALLADDMGLGKTIQTIAWLLVTRSAASSAPALVVAPLTLLANWRHEFAKFAPELKAYVHQGEGRHLASGFRQTALSADVVVTSYNLLVKDHSLFAGVEWGALVLDEAQAVKNADTQAARAACALSPVRRVALSGTPIENSVADIWSIEEFLNPGFLGDRKDFEERFVKPLAADEQSVAGKRLKYALEPFVLRRLKSEPGIAADLGAKREIKEYCSLSPAQRADYELALEDFRTGERRQGDVFALITRLKLICDGMDGETPGGGKLERLYELLESVFAGGESALVFTQYAKVGLALQRALAARFGRKFPFLHGGLSVSQREAEIAKFNRMADRSRYASAVPNAFILSLKAGGFGLNLTKATHVIHFDRWWNPAVENQATDRAHRIGQTKTVFVHQFIAAGTLEEHVDEILERKSRVAGTLVQSGESFLAQLSPDELVAAVALE